jgi:hypothetical protein
MTDIQSRNAEMVAVREFVRRYRQLREASVPDRVVLESVFRDMFGEELFPLMADLRGIAPNATGELRSEEFVAKLRDAWEETE